jgi:NADH dehydrogenase
VVDIGFLQLTGLVTWLVWCLAHIYFLIGFRNRLAVALGWLSAYATFQSGARLITEVETDEPSSRQIRVRDLSRSCKGTNQGK